MARPLLGHIPAGSSRTTRAEMTGHHEGIAASLKLGQSPCLVVLDHPHSPQAIGGPVGEGGDAVSLAAFIADQRTSFGVLHAVACRALTVSEAWFYKWSSRQHRQTPTLAEQRRAELDAAVAVAFEAAHGLHGSPRIHADLRGGVGGE